MSNKIAGFTLNSSQKNLCSEFYIAQPDGVKENLGGKLFLLLQADNKKSDVIEFADFLVDSLNKNYYEDQKILLREKLDNLKVENIFEAMLTKINEDIANFFEESKTKIDLKKLNLSIGLSFNNEIYFSQIGNNKAFVIYKKDDEFETLKLSPDQDDSEENINNKIDKDKIFKNVLSGEIPSGAYFVLSNETLSEYILSETFKDIIINLPPISALEQIKNKLKEINSHVPFSGIIVKNTYGQIENDKYSDSKNTINEDVNLIKTEEKTAKILAITGLINKKKLKENFHKIIKKVKVKPKNDKLVLNKKDDTEKIKEESVNKINDNRNKKIKKSKDSNSKLQLKDKIFMKKKPGFLNLIKSIFNSIPLINKNSLSKSKNNLKIKKVLNLQRREKFIALGILLLIILFITSIMIMRYNNKQEEIRLAYQEQIKEIEKNQNQIESYLLYDNEGEAKKLLTETKGLIDDLPIEKENQLNNYQKFQSRSDSQYKEVRHVINVEPIKIASLENLSSQANLKIVDNSLYLADSKNTNLFKIDKDNNLNEITVDEQLNELKYPFLDSNNNLNYYNGKNVSQIELPEEEFSNIDFSLPDEDSKITTIEGYGTRFYILDKDKNQVYRYNSNFNFNTKWINNPADLNSPIDFDIDVSIYFVNKQGQISKFTSGSKDNFNLETVDPKIENAEKMMLTDSYIYISEPTKNRLIKYTFKSDTKESANFTAQFKINLDNIKDIIVKNDNLAYILAGNNVYTINLKIEN